ncbi:hypothetical protein [Bacteroides nordii]|uniref:hypothetical protein n=1 Tax=Bacteroides nordii TaxID=291645 RepID=UPI0011C23085|nr:hypothetical protein [Bacteroides nordii]MCG4769885.1 hypothetical protein [Bacteroides nordii]
MSSPPISFSGIDKALSRRVTYEASVCNVVLDVHVKQYDMHMWDSTTCACGAVKHVHVKQCSSPGKGVFLSEKDKVQHRTRATMPSMDTSATEKIGP